MIAKIIGAIWHREPGDYKFCPICHACNPGNALNCMSCGAPI